MDNFKVVSTINGLIRGAFDEKTGQQRFLSIPYAEPPMGALRFKPPVPKAPWEGILDATRFSAASPQVFDPTEGNYAEFTDTPEKKAWVGSEDSLTLNVWTPAADGKKRPVVVWIHGGANWLESSRLDTYHGDRLVARGDIVFVSFNYRLGVFGWLDMSVLGGDSYRGSHSHGLYDQLTALLWIKSNIAVFGGDPDNITIMGESAGSIDLSWLLTSGHLDGIARRVVLMSGIAGLIGLSGDLTTGFTESYAQKQSRALLQRLGISSMQDMMGLSTDDIMERVTEVSRASDTLLVMDSLFWPRAIPEFTPLDPFRAAAAGGGRGIDVIIGYTAYEMGLWLFWDDMLDQRPCAWSADKIIGFDADAKKDAAVLYEKVFAGDLSGAQGMHLIGDSIFVMPSMWFADILARRKDRVWMYQFDRESNGRQRALHAADQTYLFGSMDTHAGHSLLGMPKDRGERIARQALSEAMQDSILSFARFGDPNAAKNSSVPFWPQYDEGARQVLSFDFECKILQDPAASRREWWYERYYKPALD